ncbi:hypothetical protein HC752_14475 [Vibrio sp. S9_S30]|uniref:hypothetical protein n=1 Tax=Vibrio sp. S9_S30 TaxID=2720226 RepID=UPI0016802E4B|nr:hypothetical protein [Vibrio sp. S9_S30]MBD1558140.1 hypothetical protein [Vibrio sp. S9_S30]
MNFIIGRFLFLMLFFVFSTGINANSSITVMNYHDFGPPSLSGKLLGVEWFQWQSHGDSKPRNYPVKVVVYEGYDLERIENLYPVISIKEQDFRYVTFDSAIDFIDSSLADLNLLQEEGAPVANIIRKLEKTKKTLFQSR